MEGTAPCLSRCTSLSFGVVSGRSALCCGTSSVFLSAFGHFPRRAGRLRARHEIAFEKDLSHTQLRVSAPLNSPLRSQVVRSALRRLSLPVFSPFPLLALLLS